MKNLKKYYKLTAKPQDVYAALTNPDMIELWTGDKAIMSEEPGSEFSLWDGDISGVNLEFESGKLIKQQWFFDDEEHPSVVTIKLWETKGKTSVELSQTNIPDEAFENISEGWDEAYFGAIEKLFEI